MDYQATSPPSTYPTTSVDEGFDAIVDTMASLSLQGVVMHPAIQALVTQLRETAMAAEDRNNQLTHKYAQLQAEHAKLVVDYNKHCKGAGDGWYNKTKKTMYDDMCGCTKAAVDASLRWRERSMGMISQFEAMARRIRGLEMSVSRLLETRARDAAEK